MFKQKFDCVNISSKQHSSVFLLKDLNNIVAESSVELDKIKNNVIKSPSVTLKLRRILKEAYPHIIFMGCTLHADNTLSKDLCKAKPVRNVVNSNCKIVNFLIHPKFGLFGQSNGLKRMWIVITNWMLYMKQDVIQLPKYISVYRLINNF